MNKIYKPQGMGRDRNAQWDRVASDLRAYRERQRQAWGDLDDTMIARYLGGEVTEEERERIERAMREFPNVGECVEIVGEILGAVPSSVPATAMSDRQRAERREAQSEHDEPERDPDDLTCCIQHLQSPDGRQRVEAARIIWEQFASRLQSLVRRHLDNRTHRREDEQDILQSAFATFCQGQFEEMSAPDSREALWKLLVRITLCKVVNITNRHLAARRDVRRERAAAADRGGAEPSLFPRWMLDHVDRAQPSPEERMVVVEEFDRLLQGFPEDLRRIAVWKLEGFTNAEIACMIGRTVRCVELKMQLIRKRLQQESGPIEPGRGPLSSNRS
jgi:DNA-directed RNA polymerase specialized sigma24 family protein